MDSTLSIIIQSVQAVAVLVLGIGAVMLAMLLRRITASLRKVDAALDRIADDAGPALDRARAIGENLNFLVMSVRKEVERVSETMEQAHDRLDAALEVAEDRVTELSALIDVVQEEVEDTLLTATSALRGIRTGARVLTERRRRGQDGQRKEEQEEDE